MKVGICAIIKDCKASYINEWLDWHRLIGVDYFYIYDNDSAIPIQTIITNMEGIFVVLWPGPVQQLPVYSDCLIKRQEAKDCDWLAFIDDDEFIVVEKGNIKVLLAAQTNSGLCLNWIVFGGSEEGTENQTQIQKYTRHIPLSVSISNHVKSIVRVGTVDKIRHPHYVKYKDGVAVDVLGNVVNGPFLIKPVQEIAWINHYHCKSRGEYFAKIARGRCDAPITYNMKAFDSMDSQATEYSTRIQEIQKILLQ